MHKKQIVVEPQAFIESKIVGHVLRIASTDEK